MNHITGYRTWLVKHEQKSDQTVRQYVGRIEAFVQQMPKYTTLRPAQINGWYDRLCDLHPTTANAWLAAVRSFYKYLIQQKGVKRDPTAGLKRRKIPKRERKLAREDDLEQILSVADDLQDKTMFELLFGSGLRRDELARLAVGNITGRRTLSVIGKGNKERTAPLTERGYNCLRKLLLDKYGDKRTAKLRKDVDDDAAFSDIIKRYPDEPVFYSTTGIPLPDYADPGQMIYLRVKKIARRAGLGELHPHLFRAGMITTYLERGAQLPHVREAAGHEDIKTTQEYIGLLHGGAEDLSRRMRTA